MNDLYVGALQTRHNLETAVTINYCLHTNTTRRTKIHCWFTGKL